MNGDLKILIVASVSLLVIIALIIYFYLNNKFIKYMNKNYPIIKKTKSIHYKYDKSLIRINRTIELKDFWVNSKAQFDRHKIKFTLEQIEQFYNHFENVKKISLHNKNQLFLYNAEINDAVIDYKKNTTWLSDKYRLKKQKRYLNKFVSRNKNYRGKYSNTDNFYPHGSVRYTLRYVSPQGRNSYRYTMSASSGQINNMYQEHIAIPREKERIKEEQRQNRLYHNKIYFFKDDHLPGMICIGQTTQENVKARIRQEYKLMPLAPYELLHWEFAQYNNSKKWFTDHSFHKFLEKKGYFHETNKTGKKTEWFMIDVSTAKTILLPSTES